MIIFKTLEFVLHEIGIIQSKLERFRRDKKSRKLTLQRKKEYYKDKSNREDH